MDVFIALGIFIISFFLVIILRKGIAKNYEIKNTDILIGLIPLALWLILTGKITSFEYGDLKIATAFAQANNKPISESITDIYKSNLNSAEKESLYQLEEILESKPEALIFYSGEYRYDHDVIEQYLRKLSAYTLKYMIIKDSNEDFIGIIQVDQFMSQTLTINPKFRPERFAEWLNEGNNLELENIKGMVTYEESVTPDFTKILALEKMQSLNTKFLPVVEDKKLIGIIEMDHLSTSLLMEISKILTENEGN